MFNVFKRSALSYSGNSSYRHVERLMRKGHEIFIVSPYIDSYYATVIRRLSGSRKFSIITSSIDSGAKSILDKKLRLSELIAYLLFSIGVSYIAIAVFNSLLYALFAMFLYCIYAALRFVYSTNGNIKVIIPRDFVHAKMYISEDEAIVGSANLTYSGMHKNVEHIEIIRDKASVENLRKDFYRLWKAN